MGPSDHFVIELFFTQLLVRECKTIKAWGWEQQEKGSRLVAGNPDKNHRTILKVRIISTYSAKKESLKNQKTSSQKGQRRPGIHEETSEKKISTMVQELRKKLG